MEGPQTEDRERKVATWRSLIHFPAVYAERNSRLVKYVVLPKLSIVATLKSNERLIILF